MLAQSLGKRAGVRTGAHRSGHHSSALSMAPELRASSLPRYPRDGPSPAHLSPLPTSPHLQAPRGPLPLPHGSRAAPFPGAGAHTRYNIPSHPRSLMLKNASWYLTVPFSPRDSGFRPGAGLTASAQGSAGKRQQPETRGTPLPLPLSSEGQTTGGEWEVCKLGR